MEHETVEQRLAQWAEKGRTADLPAWEDLPSIPLYMDQVIYYLAGNLELFRREEGSGLLTSSMINNYVKNGVLSHPDKKKYGREHLGALMAVCMLKQVLTIGDIKTLLSGQELGSELYELFRETHSSAMEETCRVLEEDCKNGVPLREAALALAVQANAQRAAAERILAELDRAEHPEEKKEKEKKQ